MNMPAFKLYDVPGSQRWRFWLAVTFLLLVALLGGGSRADIASLAVLRPVAVVFGAIALVGISRDGLRAVAWPLFVCIAIMGLALSQLIPLPPSWWQALPGREIYAEAAHLTGNGERWYPITLYPSATRNAVLAMIVPVAFLLTLAHLDARQRITLGLALLGIIATSALLSLAQILGPSNSVLYTYQITNNGSPVGLLANRNHNAILLACGVPLLAVMTKLWLPSLKNSKMIGLLAVVASFFILLIIIATGSRAGFAIAMVGVVAAVAFTPPEYYNRLRLPASLSARPRLVFAAALILSGVILLSVADRTLGLQRVFAAQDMVDDMRFQALPEVWSALGAHFPVGAGGGSFADVFMLFEPANLVRDKYFNHAHTDILEVVLEYGLPGLILMVAALGMIVLRILRLACLSSANLRKRQANRLSVAGLGGVIVLLMIAGSVFDYPLRVPLMAVVITLAATWFFQDVQDET